MTDRTIRRLSVIAVCLLLLGTAMVMAVHALALAADGAYYLLVVLGTGEVAGPDSRVLGNALRQAPALAAADLGVTNTYVLSALLGVGQLILPTAAWCTAIALARSRAWAFVAVSTTATLCLGAMWFFSVGESGLAVPLTVLMAVLLWQPHPWRWAHAALALAASVVLVATYESALVTGVILALWAAWRMRGSRSAADRWGGAGVALLSASSVLAAIASLAEGQESTWARSSLYFAASVEPWQFYVALAAIAAVVLALTVPVAARLRHAILALGTVVALAAISDLPTTSVAAFKARGGAVGAGFALVVLLAWQWARERRSVAPTVRRAADTSLLTPLIAVVFAGAMMVASLQGVDRWSRSLDAFRSAVDGTRGIAGVNEVLPPDRRRVVWGWTSSSLSLIVRRDARSGILVDANPSLVPFAPSAAREQLPDRFAWRPPRASWLGARDAEAADSS